MGVQYNTCEACNDVRHEDSTISCHNCCVYYCEKECAADNIVQYADGSCCRLCDKHTADNFDNDYLLSWIVEKYLPDKSLSDLEKEYKKTLKVKSVMCFNCRRIECDDIEEPYEGKFPKDLYKYDYHMEFDLIGWCCNCAMDDYEDYCEQCKKEFEDLKPDEDDDEDDDEESEESEEFEDVAEDAEDAEEEGA